MKEEVSKNEENLDELVSVKIVTVLDKPNCNGFIVKKQSFISCIKDMFKENRPLYITKVQQGKKLVNSPEIWDNINESDILGEIYAINLDEHTAYVKPIDMDENVLNILKSHVFGFRADADSFSSLGDDFSLNKTAIINRIISYDIVREITSISKDEQLIEI